MKLRTSSRNSFTLKRSSQLGELFLYKGIFEYTYKPLWYLPSFEVQASPFTISNHFKVLEWWFLTTPCLKCWKSLEYFLWNLVKCKSKCCRSKEWEDISEAFLDKNMIWDKLYNAIFYLYNECENVLVGHELLSFWRSLKINQLSISIVYKFSCGDRISMGGNEISIIWKWSLWWM